MSDFEIKKRKVYGETAIPSGTYKVILSYSPKFKRILPEILDVKGFTGIRLHNGSEVSNSLGCPLLGRKYKDGFLTDSKKTTNSLIQKLKDQKDITLTITYVDYGKENIN